ncbi:MAG: FadR/GntR family transcriptional regulator, partial [Rubrobacter sp.]
MDFQRIESRKLYIRIAEQILERVQSGVLPAGSKLPAERDLALQMGVSRPSVREALIALELLGVVEIRI